MKGTTNPHQQTAISGLPTVGWQLILMRLRIGGNARGVLGPGLDGTSRRREAARSNHGSKGHKASRQDHHNDEKSSPSLSLFRLLEEKVSVGRTRRAVDLSRVFLVEKHLGFVERVSGAWGRRENHLTSSPSPTHGSTMDRTMLNVNIDRDDSVLLRRSGFSGDPWAIAEGEAGPGERLPLAKNIAAVLGVNKNTVLRAMHILRDEGLLEFTGVEESLSPVRRKRARSSSQVRDLVEFGRHRGYKREDVIEMIATLP